ncbi:hypothetical protein AGMMS4952_27140 [Spirochaetia bacterium]|nr:hypothetical protein AGMMS4952_27140 [Spirochaetia bacterium]
MAYKEEIDEDCENCKSFHPGRPAKMYLRNGDPGYPAEDDECDYDWECPYLDEEEEEEEASA